MKFNIQILLNLCAFPNIQQEKHIYSSLDLSSILQLLLLYFNI